MKRVLLIAAIALAPQVAQATEAGIDVGWVVVNGEPVDAHERIDSLGVDWVRINFRLDAWNSPDDTTPHGSAQLTWFAAYDRIVDGYLARGYQIYGLINDEAVASLHPHASDPWISDYVHNARAIVDHFKDRIRVYEIINEPNDWAGGTASRFPAAAFAQILQDTYLAVKHEHAGDRCWQVDLVSGALFSYDDASSADYLAETYEIGRTELAWDWTREHAGSFPLDGIGYHMYVAQGTDSSLADLRSSMHDNIAAVVGVAAAHGDDKRMWVSEFGWRADQVGAEGQADRLAAGFAAMHELDGRVAVGMYFGLQDFPDNEWGVFDAEGDRRPSADRLAEVAAAQRPARGASVTSVEAPALVAGQPGELVVTLVNRGAQTWDGEIRLAAAPGCPDATHTNELDWIPIDGYANGTLDARVFLPHAVAPGESIELRVPVVAPAAGEYRFAARMVEEGVGWFGATATAIVPVADAEQAKDGDAPGDVPGGCATMPQGSSGLAFGVLLLALRRRR